MKITIPFSVLDLAPIVEGATAGDALRSALSLAQHAERLGYRRYWLAEHHNMPGIASAATAVVIAHVAGATERIRVGSGGVMLPNHSPLVVAEQFGTLESLFPDRIDLGLGRAPGTDPLTAHALRRDLTSSAERFPQDVIELQRYFGADNYQKVRAIPGVGLRVPIWLLGSSLFSAQLAARLGLPFAFASHFAPDAMMSALDLYRRNFESSEQLARPHVMLGVNVFAADTSEEARRLFTSLQQAFIRLRRGMPTPLPPPVDDIDRYCSAMERAGVDHALQHSFVGDPDKVKSGLETFINETSADELMITSQIFDHDARLKSFQIAADFRSKD